MNIATAMDDIASALNQIPKLKGRNYPFWADSVVVPASVVAWPTITFNAAYARGMSTVEVEVFVLAGKIEAKASRDQLAAFLQGSGESSVRAAIDAFDFREDVEATTREARVEMIAVNGIDYLAGIFTVVLNGTGD